MSRRLLGRLESLVAGMEKDVADDFYLCSETGSSPIMPPPSSWALPGEELRLVERRCDAAQAHLDQIAELRRIVVEARGEVLRQSDTSAEVSASGLRGSWQSSSEDEVAHDYEKRWLALEQECAVQAARVADREKRAREARRSAKEAKSELQSAVAEEAALARLNQQLELRAEVTTKEMHQRLQQVAAERDREAAAAQRAGKRAEGLSGEVAQLRGDLRENEAWARRLAAQGHCSELAQVQVVALRGELEAYRSAEDARGHQRHAERARLGALEGELADQRTARNLLVERHLRTAHLEKELRGHEQKAMDIANDHLQALDTLKQELASAQRERASHSLEHCSNLSRIEELTEDVLREATLRSVQQQRLLGLEGEMDELSEELHAAQGFQEQLSREARQKAALQQRVAELEDEVEELRVARDTAQVHRARRSTSEHLRQEELIAELEGVQAVASHEARQHARQHAERSERMAELQHGLHTSQELQRISERRYVELDKRSLGLQATITGLEQRADALMAENSRLREELRRQGQAVAGAAPATHGRARDAASPSAGLAMQPAVHSRALEATGAADAQAPHSDGSRALERPARHSRSPERLKELLHGVDEAFANHISAAVAALRAARIGAADAQVALLRQELDAAVRSMERGQAAKAGVEQHAGEQGAGQEAATIRQPAVAALDASIRGAQAFMGHSQASPRPLGSEPALEYLRLESTRAEDQLELLQNESPLGDVPETLVEVLAEVHKDGLPPSLWAGDFSPAHWAAQGGRQDILEYLLRVPGGAALLSAYDVRGCTPLFYAQCTRRESLCHWLDEHGTQAPMHRGDGRPVATGALPPQARELLSQVEAHGWRAMHWEGGHSLLHWAAARGDSELCRYLLSLNADPTLQDKEGSTPMVLATISGHTKLAGLLQSAAGAATPQGAQPSLAQDLDSASDASSVARQVGAVHASRRAAQPLGSLLSGLRSPRGIGALRPSSPTSLQPVTQVVLALPSSAVRGQPNVSGSSSEHSSSESVSSSSASGSSSSHSARPTPAPRFAMRRAGTPPIVEPAAKALGLPATSSAGASTSPARRVAWARQEESTDSSSNSNSGDGYDV